MDLTPTPILPWPPGSLFLVLKLVGSGGKDDILQAETLVYYGRQCVSEKNESINKYIKVLNGLSFLTQGCLNPLQPALFQT